MAYQAINAGSVMLTGEMIRRRDASETNAVRQLAPSLNIALLSRFETVEGDTPASRAFSLTVIPRATHYRN
ncbi:hypothetical protein QS468_29525 [Bacillus subtilis]|nr:hypothetical protein [Bacillus subtilis]